MARKLRIQYPGAVEWVGGEAARPAQGAPGQSRSRAPAAAGEDPEPEMDRPAAGAGDLDPWVEPAQRGSRRFTRPGGAAPGSIVTPRWEESSGVALIHLARSPRKRGWAPPSNALNLAHFKVAHLMPAILP